MAYTEDERNERLSKIFEIISNGKSLRKALLEVKMSSTTFFEWIDGDSEKTKQYARACEERAEALIDEMIDIADDTSNDTYKIEITEGVEVEKTNYEAIQRSKLKYDARKWLVSKLNPKKYSEKNTTILEGGEKAIEINFLD